MKYAEKTNATIYVENLKVQKDMYLAVKDLIENKVYKHLSKAFYKWYRDKPTEKQLEFFEMEISKRLNDKFAENMHDDNYVYYVDNLSVQKCVDKVVWIEFEIKDALRENQVCGSISLNFDKEKDEYVPSVYLQKYLEKLEHLIGSYSTAVEQYDTIKKKIISSKEEIEPRKYPHLIMKNFFVEKDYKKFRTIYY